MMTFVVNSLWQGLIVVVLTAAALALVPRRNAATRYAVWFLALFALVAVPSASAWWHAGVQLLPPLYRSGASNTGTYSFVLSGAFLDDAARWLTLPSVASSPLVTIAVAVLWAGGAAIGLTRLAISFYRIRKLVAGAAPLSVIDGIAVLSSRELAVPIATGVVSPAIVIPAELAGTLDAHDLRCTIEHELAHVRRGDVLANALQRIVEALLFWNPWMQIAGRRLAAEREAACDDLASMRIGEPRAYALCLAALGRRIAERSAPLLTPGAFGTRNTLVARIERLMADGAPNARLNYAALGGMLVTFAALTFIFQALVPSSALAQPLQPTASAMVAAACTKPDAEPAAIDPVPPQLAKAQWPKEKVWAQVAVSISPSGKVTGAKIYRSSGNAAVDNAVLTAAEKSTYSPKIVNCVAVAGSYLFRADLAP